MIVPQKVVLCLTLLLIVANSFSICPSGALSYDTMTSMKENGLKYRSLGFDVFYQMTYVQGVFTLNCRRVVDQQSNPDPILQITNSSIPGQRSWKIQAVSQRGSCVAVKQDKNLVAYNTYSGAFVQVQSIDVSSLGKKVEYSVDDNCVMINALVTLENGTVVRRVFKNTVQTESLNLPLGTLYSYDFGYAIDTASNFYQLDSTTYTTTQVSSLRSTPLYIKWSSLIKSIITISKDQTGYTIVLINPTNSSEVYSKKLVSGTDYNGELAYLVRTSFGSIMLRDDNGFVNFIQFELVNSVLTVTENTLENTTYSSLFSSTAKVSVSSDIIFVYSNQKITYFQAYTGKLYFLGQLATDIEAKSEEQIAVTDAWKSENAILLSAPVVLNLCSPIPSTQTNLTPSASQTTNGALVDQSTGKTLKCPDNCAVCTSVEVCSICRVGYSLNDATGKCVFCKGCYTCSPTNPDTCYLCFAPAVLNRTSSTCLIPTCNAANCLLCDISGNCTRCKYGYGLANSACQKCSVAGCKSCAVSADSCDANSCMLGYAYYFNPSISKGFCQSCVSGCYVCLTTDLSACSSCAAGYYSAADSSGINKCYTCFENCKVCTAAKVCTVCASGYTPSSDGSSCTLICSGNCLTCSQTNATSCLTCYGGSVLNETSNKCSIDILCNQTSTCLACADGSVLNIGQCFTCTYTDTNCQGCQYDTLSACSRCNTGYYLSSNGTCVQCEGNCSSCVAQNACVKCNDAFYLVSTDSTQTGICQACDSSCLTCTSTSITCTSCTSGFVLEGSRCISTNRVALEMVIQANVNNFIEFMEDLIQWFVDQANAGKSPGSDDINAQQVAMLNTKSYGSSVISVLVSAQSSSNANSIASALDKAVNSGSSIDGYQIISGSATAQTNYAAVATTSSSNLGLILGICIPVGILLLVAIGIISYKVHQRKQENNYNNKSDAYTDGEKNSGKEFRYDHEKNSEKI